jgi:hypothetical protein
MNIGLCCGSRKTSGQELKHLGVTFPLFSVSSLLTTLLLGHRFAACLAIKPQAQNLRGSTVPCKTTPFDNIEGALEYVTCLLAACDEARLHVDAEIGSANGNLPARRKDALKLVDYKLERLGLHLKKSESLLKDLARLRRIILAERGPLTKGTAA